MFQLWAITLGWRLSFRNTKGTNTFPASSDIPTPAVFIHPKCNVVDICLVKGVSTYRSYTNQSLKLNEVPAYLLSPSSEQGEHTNTIKKKCLSSVTCHFQPVLEAKASLCLWPVIKPLSQESSRTLGFQKLLAFSLLNHARMDATQSLWRNEVH